MKLRNLPQWDVIFCVTDSEFEQFLNMCKEENITKWIHKPTIDMGFRPQMTTSMGKHFNEEKCFYRTVPCYNIVPFESLFGDSIINTIFAES